MIDLDAAPLVLAGPMVRRVDDCGASVWIALQDARSITLTAIGEDGATHTGTAVTHAIGERLHVAVVTAAGPFEWGHLYEYDLAFAPVDESRTAIAGALFTPGIVARDGDDARRRLTYRHLDPGAPDRPSFALPPAELDRVRLAFSSCRLPHGPTPDALDAVDVMLGQTASVAAARPQQLFLTGDQIYGNEVSPALLARVTELGDQLLGWVERLPSIGCTTAMLPPGTREHVVRAHVGLLQPGDENHLLGLGEYLAMYLLVWSDTLWPEDMDPGPLHWFREALPRVRRALANIATYMVLDDHEVTDDLYLTLEWCRSVLGRPLGRRVLSNAFAAYAIFQAWGNAPAQFDEGHPGASLLHELAAWRGETGARAESIEALLGMPRADALTATDPPSLQPPPVALAWHYRIATASHEVIVLDVRTRRAFPGARNTDPPELLSDRGLADQLAAATFDRPLTIVVSAFPLIDVPRPWYARATLRWKYRWQWLKKGTPRGYATVYGPDRGDDWAPDSRAFQSLLSTLAARCDRAVFLSGDVHIGFAARLDYRTGDRALRIAQLVSGSLNKVSEGTRVTHGVGYGVLARPPTGMLRGTLPTPWTAEHMFVGGNQSAADDAPLAPAEASYPADFIDLATVGSYRVRHSGQGRQIVGRANLGEVRFVWSATCMEAVQINWWRLDDSDPILPLTTFRVGLEKSGEDGPEKAPE